MDEARSHQRETWPSMWQRLVELGVVDPADCRLFDEAFTETPRPSAVAVPGLVCWKGWPLSEAQEADDQSRMPALAAGVLNELLDALADHQVQVPGAGRG